jgi:hypothetical protein
LATISRLTAVGVSGLEEAYSSLRELKYNDSQKEDTASEVVKIHTLREWAVSSQPPMHTARQNHAAVYHSQNVYVLGRFFDESFMRRCKGNRQQELKLRSYYSGYLQ